MLTSGQPDIERILSKLSSAEGFDGDAGNIDKNRKHGVEQSEIEQVFFNPPSVIIADVEHSEKEAQWKILGRSDSGRSLVVVFTMRKNLIRPIYARAMNRKERTFYEEEVEKNTGIQQ